MTDLKKPARSRNKVSTMQKISEAAREMFSNCSYEAASTKKIAEKAGVNSALIFNYFGSKQGLLSYVFEDLSRQSKADVLSYQAQGTPMDEMKAFAVVNIEHALKNRELLKSVLFLQNYEHSYELEGYYSLRTGLFKERLDGFKAAGQIRADIDTGNFAVDFLHLLDGMLMTFCVYSNETREYITPKIFNLIDKLAGGIA